MYLTRELCEDALYVESLFDRLESTAQPDEITLCVLQTSIHGEAIVDDEKQNRADRIKINFVNNLKDKLFVSEST
jgi:hypothetical protein